MKCARELILATLWIACGCGGDSNQTSPPAAAAPVQSAAPTAAPAPAPAQQAATPPAAAAGARVTALRGDPAAGAKLYATYCASCHGSEGKGDGPVATSLKPPPANHADHVYMGTLSDEHLYTVIAQGGATVGKSPMMAPWRGVINDQGIRDLIAFIRKLSNT